MDSDSSSEEPTTTESSTDSSDDEKLETVQLCGTRIQIPQGLCEQKEVFDEFLSVHTWNSLSEANKQHLRQFMPTFPENDEQEKTNTVHKLLGGEVFRFFSPLSKFHEHLKAGHFRPDIAKMRYMIRKAERKEAKCRYRKFREQLEGEVVESRQNLIHLINTLPPGVEPRVEKCSTNSPAYVSPIANRTKRRYFQELAAIRGKVDESGFSSDENYPEGPPTSISRKQKRNLNSIRNSHTFNGETYVSTMATKSSGLDLERNITPNNNPFFITEDAYKQLLLNHKKRKLDDSDNPELNTKGINLNDVIKRTKLTYVKKLNNVPTNTVKHHLDSKLINRKKHKKPDIESFTSHLPEFISKDSSFIGKANPFFGHSSNSELDSDSDSLLDAVLSSSAKTKRSKPNKVKTEIKTEINYFNVNSNSADKNSSPSSSNNFVKNAFSQYGKITPATFSDLDGIDMMNLPIDLDDSNIDILDMNNKPELMQETHANFLSLIRDIICSTNEHRMNYTTLEERLKAWQANPISPLNDWYSKMDHWVSVLQSAINFLSGNFPEQPYDFVPYIEYKPQLDVYQWIGAGRDSDGLLSPLSQYWLDHRNEIKSTSQKEEKELDVEVADRSQTPPPPRCPTTWFVRKADVEEVKSYREQERRRYDNPHKAFTYRCNGYESVVGPLKGIYNPSVGSAKARGHTMLSADRPNFVTILSLVRDATARLPNGEGTRADICELLKSSQYISSTAPDNVLQSVVSGALDRMHTQFDPCVKYDPKRKIWIYLHRNRSEEDFERIHQQYQGMNKNSKKAPSKTKTPSKPKVKNDKPKTSPQPVEKLKVVQKTKTSANQNQLHISNSPQNIGIGQQELNCSGSSKPVTSLLLPQVNKLSKIDAHNESMQSSHSPQHKATVKQSPTPEEKEISVQAIIQNSSSPGNKSLINSKSVKNVVKLITPNQGKSLIIPSAQNAKQEQKISHSKIIHAQSNVAQKLLHSIAAQQKQLNTQQIRVEVAEKMEPKVQNKVPISIQQQILQTISPQQLQNIKNVALLRNVSQRQSPQNISTSQTQTITIAQNAITNQHMHSGSPITVQKGSEQPGQHIRVQQTSLTPSQQQQILQSLKQKVLPMQSTVLGTQQQVIVKHKTGIAQLQKHIQAGPGTSLLGQSRLTADAMSAKPIITSGQSPLVAKVLTNAAGQVISVESLLAHQKQHGSLPQGTTLRVSGVKGGQANIIQLAAPSKQNPVTQLAVGSQNNFIAITSQPKLVLASQSGAMVTTTMATTTKTSTKAVAKGQMVTKFSPKIAQQLINAKFITQNVDAQKLVQPKVIIGQNQLKLATNKNMNVSKPVSLGVTTNANTIRMVNAANLNLTHIGGKPVLLASKGTSLQSLQGQNVIIQTQANSTGLVALSTAKSNVHQQTTTTANVSLLNQQGTQVVLAPQLKVQQSPQMVLSSNIKQAGVQHTQGVAQNQLVLGGHPVRLQTSAGGAQRVVLASQGQGGQIVAQQILLPAGFQGTAINIKALQGVKVIPIAQAQQSKGMQGRQVFARVMNPANIVRTVTSSTADLTPSDMNTPTTE